MTSKTSPKKCLIIMAAFLIASCGYANADFTFGTATNLGPTVNSSSKDGHRSISADGLSLYFSSNRPGGSGGWELYVATRAGASEPWGPPANLGQTVNSSAMEVEPSISADGLSLYFADGVHFQSVPRPGGLGRSDIWLASRATASDPWRTPVNLGPPVNTGAKEGGPTITGDGLTLVFDSDRPGGSGGHDLWMTTRPTISDPWGPPVNLGPTVNSSALDGEPGISLEGLALFFMSNRTGDYDIWVTTRPTVSDNFGTPVHLAPPVNSSAIEAVPCISADGSTLFFLSQRSGGYGDSDLWQVPITLIVDFNGDQVVDLADFSRLAGYWFEDEPSCDIGPPPLGDGKVDIRDVAVLAEHWLEGAGPIAHWKLDETAGGIAHDSIAGNDAFGPADLLWRPEGGKVGGALELDGVDDFLFTAFSLNPADTSFSVFAWVKGGAPGQVIISQAGGANWLLADPTEGKLMTELKSPGRFGSPLVSQTVITNGDWQRIGLVWDGSNRTLYVDDAEVAKDTQAGLTSAYGGLYFGAAKDLDAGSFWSGLIDDVRIYDEALSAGNVATLAR